MDAYIDDIMIYSDTWEELTRTIKTVFQRLKSAKLVINLSKSDFDKAEVKYLGNESRIWEDYPNRSQNP